jgi:deoxyribose-phosphate aldolase
MELNSFLDATLLRADLTSREVIDLCNTAKEFKVAAVCVPGRFVGLVAKELRSSGVIPCTVVGFPLGNTSGDAKIAEAELALKQGAKELDMVIQLGALKERKLELVEQEISKIVKLGAVVKVIIETALLTEEEIILATQCVESAKAQYVKTSTGFSTRGASLNDIHVIKSAIKSGTKIKASGGIKTKEFALELVRAGASRIGTSSPASLLDRN